MNREEEILQAAADTFKVCGGEFDKAVKMLWITAFIAGVDYADRHPKNVWHDVSEMPNESYPIIIEIDDDIDPTYEVITVNGVDEEFWEFLANDRCITRWAYISDLLPKGGEE